MLICEVFKSSRKEETYLYVERARGLQDVPEVLIKQFGEPESVMVIPLTAERELARVNTADVLSGIANEGFYLQMPPTMTQLLSRDGASE